MEVTSKQPLFIITGASGVGKSTICNELFAKEKDYIVMESDLLWNDVYNTPKDNYKAYRKLWMNVCANISQIGLPVVFCGCGVPEQFENLPERDMFSNVYYLAIVCDDNVLENRMRTGRGIDDENWIKSSTNFNNWLKQNANLTTPCITLLDTSTTSLKQACEMANKWIINKLI